MIFYLFNPDIRVEKGKYWYLTLMQVKDGYLDSNRLCRKYTARELPEL